MSNDQSLNALILRELDENRDVGPREIALRLLPDIGRDDLEALAVEGLIERIRAKIAFRRGDTATLVATRDNVPVHTQQPPGRYEWPSQDELAGMLGDGSFGALADRLGIPAPTVRKHCQNLGIEDCFDRNDRDRRKMLYDDLARVADDFADQMRIEGVEIGLQHAATERVCVAGEWMFLADCSAEDLRTLASEYIARSGVHLERGAYYSFVADQLETGGYANVRALCERKEVVA